jgi:hypothetical protein
LAVRALRVRRACPEWSGRKGVKASPVLGAARASPVRPAHRARPGCKGSRGHRSCRE